MKTEALDNCLRIFNGICNEDESLTDELLSPDLEIDENFIIPFSKELNKNLIDKKGEFWEKDLFEFYLKELARFIVPFLYHYELLFEKTYLGQADKWKSFFDEDEISLQANKSECYILIAFILYERIFYEIKAQCESKALDFFDICNRLKIKTGIFKATMELRSNPCRRSAMEYWLYQNHGDSFLSRDPDQTMLKKNLAHYILGSNYLIQMYNSPFYKAYFQPDPSELESADLLSENNEIINETDIEILKRDNTISINEVSSDKDTIQKSLDEIANLENKFWKGIPMNIVIQHFEVMTEKKNKNDQFFLTKTQFISFLKKGFLNDTEQPKQKINCSHGEKGFVIKRFYDFFDLAVSQYWHIQKTGRFIKLFNDCFDNWDPNTIKPFFKRNRTKDKW